MTWNKYLRDTAYIHNKTNIPYKTIRAWIYRNRVPVCHFDVLESVLKLTHQQMRELNDTAKS
jgi:hypothetical protein